MSTPPNLDLPAGARARILRTARGDLAIHEAGHRGDGPTALLVPGFNGSKEDFIAALGPLAARGFHVVALDQRGQWESTGPDDASAYTLEALGDDLLAVVTALGRGPVHGLGHSLGGLVLRAAALTKPAAFRSITLLSSGPGSLVGPRVDGLRQLGQVLGPMEPTAVWDAMRALDEQAGVPEPPPEVLAFLRRRFLANNTVGLKALADVLLTTNDRVGELAATGLPIHVVYGVDDDAWPPQVQAEMADRLGARRTVVKGAAHSPAAEQPSVTAAALSSFWGEMDKMSRSVARPDLPRDAVGT